MLILPFETFLAFFGSRTRSGRAKRCESPTQPFGFPFGYEHPAGAGRKEKVIFGPEGLKRAAERSGECGALKKFHAHAAKN